MPTEADAGTLKELRRHTLRLTHAKRKGDVPGQTGLLTELARGRILRGEFDKAEAACLRAADLAPPNRQRSRKYPVPTPTSRWFVETCRL